MLGQLAPRRSARLIRATDVGGVGGNGLILTDLAPDALALIYGCLGSKEDRWSLMHCCKHIHSLPQLRAMVGEWVGAVRRAHHLKLLCD